MIDIVDFTSSGMVVVDTQTQMAANILSVQLGSLEYAPDLGIDLRYFLTEPVKFQNEGFKGYLIQTLARRGINVASMIEVLHPLSVDYDFTLSKQESTTALVAR